MMSLTYWLLSFWDTLAGHMIVVFYLFVVMNERVTLRRLKKAPALLLSPLAATALAFAMSLVGMEDRAKYTIISCVILLLCTLWLTWAWRICFWRAFSAVCMAGILQTSTSAVVQVIFSLIPGYSFLSYITAYLGLALACRFVFNLLNKLRFGVYFNLLLEDKANLRQTTALLFWLEMSMDMFLMLAGGVEEDYMTLYSVLVVVLEALMVWMVVYLARRFDDQRKLQVQRDTIAQQQLYEQKLEEIRREVRAFRHDYKNLLAGLAQQAGEGDLDALCAALSRLDADFDRRLGEKIQASTQIGNLRIPQVRSLLLGKLAHMGEKGVEYRLEALYPIESVEMDVWDLVRCLGILADNAEEAALETERPWVEIIVLAQGGGAYFRIANSWNGKGEPDKFWEEGYSSKGPGRGTGLDSYRNILKKYPQTVSSTSWSSGAFMQELTIGGRP